MNKKIVWILGFVILFLLNVLVEAVLLPHWGLSDTVKNDIYFQLWWLVVAIWFFSGIVYFTTRGKEPAVS